MEFNIRLLYNIKRCYLIEISDEVTVWNVEKRYHEIYTLKEQLSKQFSYIFVSFPTKRWINSYSSTTLDDRLQGFKTFFGLIAGNKHLLESEAVKLFIRTNIYLETFENIKQADQLRDSFLKSKDLDIKISRLLEDCNFIEQEITSLSHKNTIIVKNIHDIKDENTNNISLFEEAKTTKLYSSRERNTSFQYFNELDELYIQLKRQISLVNILKSNSRERLSNIQTKTLELEAELIIINKVVNKISDPVLKDKYHIDMYQLINKIYLDKIKTELERLDPRDN